MLNLKKPNSYKQSGMVITKGWEVGTRNKLTDNLVHIPNIQRSGPGPGNHLSSKRTRTEQLEIAFLSLTENTRPEFYFLVCFFSLHNVLFN